MGLGRRLLEWLAGHLMMKAIGVAVLAGLGFVGMKVYDAVSDQPERQDAALSAADTFRGHLLADRYAEACVLVTEEGRRFFRGQHRSCAAYLEKVAGPDGVLRPWLECRTVREVVAHTARKHGFDSGDDFRFPFGRCEGDEYEVGTLLLTEVDGEWLVSSLDSSLLYEQPGVRG